MRKSAARALWLTALLVAPAASLLAHEAHASPSPQPVVAAAEDGAEAERPESPPVKVDPRAALVEHPHNKIVHFPLALGAAGAVLLLLSYRWPQFGAGARLLLIAAAAFAWIAVRTGLAAEADLRGGGLDLWLERHELAGKWTAGTLTATALLALVKQARIGVWLLALIALALVSLTGFLGGILSHPPL